MAERKKKRGKNEVHSNKLTKEEDSIAKFIRFNCPTNTTMFEGNEVHYFSGKKAVDLLVESKKYGAKAKNPKFITFAQAESFLQSLLERGLFFRAKKVVLKKKDKTTTTIVGDEKRSKEKDTPNTRKRAMKKKEAEVEAELLAEEEAENKSDEQQNNEPVQDGSEEKKKKKKIKLLAHDIQNFVVDSSGDVYVWIFDPTPFYKKLIGLLIVLGTIVGCLFPLWPDWLRLGIYYLSVTGIALFGALLAVALLRTVLFGILWAFTCGRWKLWVLPNLTEDCGFFESFKPFYTFEYAPNQFWFSEIKPPPPSPPQQQQQEQSPIAESKSPPAKIELKLSDMVESSMEDKKND